jgi:hypothetical protein
MYLRGNSIGTDDDDNDDDDGRRRRQHDIRRSSRDLRSRYSTINKATKAEERDDREVSWAAIAPPRPCHSMAWSGGI